MGLRPIFCGGFHGVSAAAQRHGEAERSEMRGVGLWATLKVGKCGTGEVGVAFKGSRAYDRGAGDGR